MLIQKIHISSFGKLSDIDITLENGVNIIEGSNEAGKSTIAAFVKFALYGLSNKTNGGALSERERYVSWENGSASGYIIISSGEKSYRIERTLNIVGQSGDSDDKKLAYRENVGITDLSNNSPVKTKLSPGEFFFGVDEEIFSKTVYVGQLEGAKISGEKMTQAIENMLFTADENVNIQKALKKLDAARVTYLHKNQKGGKIFERESDSARLEARLNEVKQINSDILSRESSLEDSKSKFGDIIERLDKLSAAVKSYESKKVIELFDTLHEIEKNRDDAAAKEAEFAEKYTKNGFLPDRGYLSEIDSAGENKRSAEARLNDAQSRLNEAKLQKLGLEKALDEKRGDFDKYDRDMEVCSHRLEDVHHLGIWIIAFVVISLLTAGVGIAITKLTDLADIGRLVLTCAGITLAGAVICLVLRMAKKSKLGQIYKSYGAMDLDGLREKLEALKQENSGMADVEKTIAELEEQLSSRRDELAQAEAQLEKLLQKCPDTDLDALLSDLELCESARTERIQNSDKAELLKKQLSSYNEAEMRSAASDSDDGITAENFSEKRRELDFLTNQSRAMETRIHELEKELAGLKPQSENSAKIAERLELNRTVINEYRLKHAAYLLAYEKIIEASESMRADISPRLAQDTCVTMGEVTGGKYTELGVDGELNLSVTVDGITRRLDTLSAGTQDAAYISLRLALMNSLFGENTPTVVFDESFSRLDKNRLRGVLSLAKKLADNGIQSIILTSGERESHLMSNIGEYNKILI